MSERDVTVKISVTRNTVGAEKVALSVLIIVDAVHVSMIRPSLTSKFYLKSSIYRLEGKIRS